MLPIRACRLLCLVLGSLLIGADDAEARKPSPPVNAPTTVASSNTVLVPTRGELEVAFSPNGGGTALVLKTIAAARSWIRVAAYSFTSVPIAKALVEAQRRGIDVAVVVDKSQEGERYTAATFLANQGVPLRVDRRHAIQHNKYVVVDGLTVLTGSFNFTKSAQAANAENVLVHWNNPDLAAQYAQDWQRHWNHGDAWVARY